MGIRLPVIETAVPERASRDGRAEMGRLMRRVEEPFAPSCSRLGSDSSEEEESERLRVRVDEEGSAEEGRDLDASTSIAIDWNEEEIPPLDGGDAVEEEGEEGDWLRSRSDSAAAP